MENLKTSENEMASRLRLTAFATLVIAVVLLCGGLALMTIHHRLQTDDVDVTLQLYSANLEDEFLEGVLPRVLPEGGSSEDVAQVVYADATVLASTANMANQRALDDPDGPVQHRNTKLAIADDQYRVLSRRVGDVVIHTATPIDHVEVADDALRTGLAFIIPALTLLFGFLAWVLLGRRVSTAPDITTPDITTPDVTAADHGV